MSLELLQQGGFVVIVLYVVLRWVLDFLKWKNGHKPLAAPNPHPTATRTGDLSASYWLEQFSDLKKVLHRIELLLTERLPK